VSKFTRRPKLYRQRSNQKLLFVFRPYLTRTLNGIYFINFLEKKRYLSNITHKNILKYISILYYNTYLKYNFECILYRSVLSTPSSFFFTINYNHQNTGTKERLICIMRAVGEADILNSNTTNWQHTRWIECNDNIVVITTIG